MINAFEMTIQTKNLFSPCGYVRLTSLWHRLATEKSLMMQYRDCQKDTSSFLALKKIFYCSVCYVFFCDFLWKWKDTLIAYSIETTMLECESILRYGYVMVFNKLNVCKLVLLYLYLSKKRSIILMYKLKAIDWVV